MIIYLVNMIIYFFQTDPKICHHFLRQNDFSNIIQDINNFEMKIYLVKNIGIVLQLNKVRSFFKHERPLGLFDSGVGSEKIRTQSIASISNAPLSEMLIFFFKFLFFQGPVRRSPRMSQASIDESLRRMSIQESGTYAEDERNANSYNGTSSSRANSIVQQQQQQDSYRDPPRNAYSRSNVSDLLTQVYRYLLLLLYLLSKGRKKNQTHRELFGHKKNCRIWNLICPKIQCK